MPPRRALVIRRRLGFSDSMSMNVVVEYLVCDIRDTFERAILTRVNKRDEYLRLAELMDGIQRLLNTSDLARGRWPFGYDEDSEEDVQDETSSSDSRDGSISSSHST
jgi:hypothetical protein